MPPTIDSVGVELVMAEKRARTSAYLVRAAGLLALAAGLRAGLHLWTGSGANSGFERLMILGGGVLVLICTGIAAAQVTLGLLTFMRRRHGPSG